MSPGGHGESGARHAGSRIGGNTQTQTLTETFGALTQAAEGADDARGCS